ncbi:uncharacterized protein K489DRAFT_377552 [Dissoconium aciculare CBS 342.82]|uniref:Chaperone/heat shock protein Hsp12 n=1 Tax=Dissoconium aciculare CBS 342.82 TaxID=1314786 RepID=A0A6J3MAX8_9PEZI|nr:uncharacterized protein K489DRAFT_377552 [Dissoconium aciculare CBS 342.82]KAF1825013.1 hypothetical protein K489DRAFT_377552 [Dissoconium aciculare CBS 342.82]
MTAQVAAERETSNCQQEHDTCLASLAPVAWSTALSIKDFPLLRLCFFLLLFFSLIIHHLTIIHHPSQRSIITFNLKTPSRPITSIPISNMSDLGRKDMSDKAQEKITPDSQKSTLQQTKETLTGTADKAARDTQPDSHKSTTQQMGDKMSGSKDSHSRSTDDKSMLDKAKDTVGLGDKH